MVSRHIGRTKDGKKIRAFKTVGGYELEVDGYKEGMYATMEEAVFYGMKEMVWSFLPQLDEDEVEQFLNSRLKISYDWRRGEQ